ncbi:MAG: hypothetical protein ACRD1T_25655, partial [Acidimicrobiia bacterium]
MTEETQASWPLEFPKGELLADIDAMVGAITETLVTNLEEGLEGLWLKGSAAKPWDSPIDYVPELSDVDIHYQIAAEGESRLAGLESAIALHSEISKRFKAARPSAIHTPRPQFVAVADVEVLSDYVPSPPATVRTLYGDPPPTPTVDHDSVRLADARRLLEFGDAQFIAKQLTGLVERPGWHLYTA